MNYETTKETAKKIRGKLKKEFAHLNLGAKHFSVTSSKYSTIYISWEDYPSREEVESIVYQYKGKYFDGMIDLEENTGYTDPDTGEHVDGFSYIDVNYTMSDKRHKIIENSLKESFPSFESYDSDEQETLIRRNNHKYDIDGFLKPEYEIKDLSDDYIKNTLSQLIFENISTINLNIPYQYLNEIQPEITVKNKKTHFGNDFLKVIHEVTNYFKNEVNLDFIKSEAEFENVVKSRIANLHYKDIPYFTKIHDDYINYLNELALESLPKYLETRNISNVKDVYKIMTDSLYDNFGDFIALEIISVSGAFSDWSALSSHGILKLYKYLDDNLEVEDISPSSESNIKKIIGEIRSELTKISFNYKEYPISTIGVYLFDNNKATGTYCVYSDNKESGDKKIIRINPKYSVFANIIRKEEYESLRDSRDGIYDNKTSEDIKKSIISNIKGEVLKYLVSRSEFILDSRVEGLLDNLLKSWIVNRKIDPAKLNNLPELQDVATITNGKLGEMLRSSVDVDGFTSKVFDKFDKIIEDTSEEITLEDVKNKILLKELKSLKETKELYVRMNKILNKQVSFDGTMLDLMKSSKYYKSINGKVPYIEYEKDNLSIIILPYACYMVAKSNKTGNYISQVIYSIKSNTLQECEQNYMRTFGKNNVDKDMKDFLNVGYYMVKNMSLR